MAQTRMRTIKKAVQTFGSEDNGSCITEYLIRKLCKSGKIKTVRVGNRIYIDLNEIQQYIDKLFSD